MDTAGGEETPQGLRRLLPHTIASVAATATTAVAGLALTVYLARVVSPTELGWFAASQSWFLLTLSLCRLGTSAGLVFALSHLRVNAWLGEPGHVLRVALVPVAALTLVVTVVYLAGLNVISAELELGQELAVALRVAAICLPLAVIHESADSVALGFGDDRPTVIVERVIRPLLQVGLAVWAVQLGLSASIIGAWTLAFAPLSLISVAWLIRIWPAKPKVGHDDRHESHDLSRSPATATGFWRYTSPKAVTTLVQALMQRGDILLVAALAGAPAAAVYTVATRFTVLAKMGNQALAVVLQPRLARAFASNDRHSAQALYARSSSWLVLLTWPMLLFVLINAETVLSFVGDVYVDAVPSVTVLAIAMLAATVAGTNDLVLLMSGRSVLSLVNVTVSLATMVALDLLLIPSLGATGAAIGWSGALLVSNVLGLLQVRRHEGLLPFTSSTAMAAVVTVASFAVLPAAVALFVGTGVEGVATTAALSVVVYVGAVFFMRRSLGLKLS